MKYDINGLTSFEIPDGVTTLSRQDFEFKGECTLKSITLPRSLEKINDDVYSIFKGIDECYFHGDLHDWLNVEINFPLFSNPNGTRLFLKILTYFKEETDGKFYELIEYVHPDIVHTIGDYQLFNVISINKVTFPYNNLVFKIGRHAFDGCKNIKEIKLSRKTIEIDDYAFENTTFMEITIPFMIEKIGRAIFKNNANLKYVRFEADCFPKELNDEYLEGSNPEVELLGIVMMHPNYA